MTIALWLIRHIIGLAFLVLGMFIFLPMAVNLMYIGIYNSNERMFIGTSALVTLIAGRCIGVGLSILSPKLARWHIDR